MPRRWLAALTVLCLSLSSVSCKRDAFVRATIDEAGALADAMSQAVHAASDKRAGVAEAQARLDAARTELENHVLELKSLRGYQMSDRLQAQWRDAFIDDLAQVEELRAGLRAQAAGDPELAEAIDALVADYAAIVSVRPPPDA